LVSLDISAAFDTIDHDVLLGRFGSEFGVVDAATSWLRSYLTDRQQYVKVGEHLSAVTQCLYGIPWISPLLGPLLFTAYVSPIRDLIESFGFSCHQFGDDTQLFVIMNASDFAPALDSLARCLAAVRSWFLCSGLQLNPDKLGVVIIGTSHQLRSATSILSINAAGSRLPVSDKLMSFSIMFEFDSSLWFDYHTSNVARACKITLEPLATCVLVD